MCYILCTVSFSDVLHFVCSLVFLLVLCVFQFVTPSPRRRLSLALTAAVSAAASARRAKGATAGRIDVVEPWHEM